MSSAAVQQQQQLQQQSPSPQQQHPSPYAQVSSSERYAAGLPTSSRHAARTGSETASLPTSPQQPQFSSPTTMSPSSRGHSSAAASGIPASASYNHYALDASTPGSPPGTSLPVRTGTQPSTPTTTNYDARSYSQRNSQSQAGYGSEVDRRSDSERRRAEPRSPREEQQPGSGKGSRTRNAPTSSRSATAVGQPPMGTDLPRENSHVINRIVVDDPQADLAREEMRKAEARPQPPGASMDMPGGPVQAAAPPRRQEHLRQASSSRKEVKFGDYILGQTLGEGEFGKVKMGWKKDSTVQVAIKLIRKESLAGNNTRLPKIYREIAILRELEHPNIVRLHEFVETERHMGIILEYASGGELFDFILTQRYLRDKDARRLFAQLVSGVGYLHQKGIVHRDLKLENLLLDRNKHIIITDFGFANTFDPNDELGEEIENRLHDKSYVRAKGLDKFIARQDGREGQYRRGDLMQTSCGSPCYAAPELVVSDGLYTGRKVDVWSCGVILYAMLAGYLPFDDDPANPEGDNINLLYKYITSTPLTFPEYVTPHARDLLRRILVPDPRKRADLFEVARHSWLSEYTHVVGFIGSRVKSEKDMAASATQYEQETSYLGRSASVREPPNRAATSDNRASTNVPRHGPAASIGGDEASDIRKQNQQRDAKRRTVQLEYVPPNVSTARGEPSATVAASPTTTSAAGPAVPKTRARAEAQGPIEVQQSQQRQDMPPPSSRGTREQRNPSETAAGYGQPAPMSASRPGTGGALGGSSRLPSRGNSYSQPAAAQPTTTTAQGSFSQPKSSSGYIISAPGQVDQAGNDGVGRPASQTQANRMSGHFPTASGHGPGRPGGHKRSSTLGSITDKILSRSNSKRTSQQDNTSASAEKRDRRYPPVSMKNALPHEDAPSRPSSDGRRPSFGFSRKASRERDSSVQGRRTSRRFSLLPSNFSVNNLLGKKDHGSEANAEDQTDGSQQSRPSRPQSKGVGFGRSSRSPSKSTLNSSNQQYYDGGERDASRANRSSGAPQPRVGSAYDKALPPAPGHAGSRGQTTETPPPMQRKQFRDDGYGSNRLDPEPAERFYLPHQDSNASGPAPEQYNSVGHENGAYDEYDENDLHAQTSLRPQQRKFGDAYEHGHGGSSSATRRVMDFFRRRGKDRSEV